MVVILKMPGNKPPITLIRRSGWYNSSIQPVHTALPHPHCAQIWILFTSSLCGGSRTVLVLYWLNPPPLSPFLTHSLFSVSLSLYFCTGTALFLCGCWLQLYWPEGCLPRGLEKKSVFIRNKQQGHIMTCDKSSQKCWRAYNILERQLNHLTSTRGCLTCVLLLSVLQVLMGLNSYNVMLLKKSSQPKVW